MGLIQLLTAGRSMVNATNRQTRYKMSRENLVPDFGNARTPKGAEPSALPAAAEREVVAEAEPQVVPEGEREVKIAAAVTEGTGEKVGKTKTDVKGHAEAKTMKTMAQSAGEAVKRTVARGMVAFPLGRWSMKAGPSVFGGARQETVQQELSLETVRVVRNDLSDADLEIVAASKPVVCQAKAVERSEPKVKTEQSLWRRMSDQLVGTGKV